MPTKPGLTDTAIRQAKPEPRPYNRYDTLGLYLTIAPTGAKWWRLKYRFAGKERRIGLGTYPEVPPWEPHHSKRHPCCPCPLTAQERTSASHRI